MGRRPGPRPPLVAGGLSVSRARRVAASLVVAGAALVLGGDPVAAQSAVDDPAQLPLGKEVYQESCAGCHGAEGTGSTVARDLLDIAAEQSDRLVHVSAVTNGKGNMPAFVDELEPDEIDAAVTFVRLSFAEGGVGSGQLPRTGGSDTLLFIGSGFVAVGAAFVAGGRRIVA